MLQEGRIRVSQTAHIFSFAEAKRSRAKAKAGRDFVRQYGSSDSAASQGGPRAAVYKGQMGHSHRKAARMQNSGRGYDGAGYGSAARAARHARSVFAFIPGRSRFSAEDDAPARRGVSLAFVIVASVIACLALITICVYPAAREYYVSVRNLAQAQAEAEAVAERNAALSENIAYIQTDAGIEAAAREEFGWIKKGENAVVVYGATDTTENKADSVNAPVVSASVKAPETWYSPLLDVVFGVS